MTACKPKMGVIVFTYRALDLNSQQAAQRFSSVDVSCVLCKAPSSFAGMCITPISKVNQTE